MAVVGQVGHNLMRFSCCRIKAPQWDHLPRYVMNFAIHRTLHLCPLSCPFILSRDVTFREISGPLTVACLILMPRGVLRRSLALLWTAIIAARRHRFVTECSAIGHITSLCHL